MIIKGVFQLRDGYAREDKLPCPIQRHAVADNMIHHCPAPPYEWEEPIYDEVVLRSPASVSELPDAPEIKTRRFRFVRMEYTAYYEEIP